MNRLLKSQTLISILPNLNRSSDRGMNEHTNGLIRQFLTKKFTLTRLVMSKLPR